MLVGEGEAHENALPLIVFIGFQQIGRPHGHLPGLPVALLVLLEKGQGIPRLSAIGSDYRPTEWADGQSESAGACREKVAHRRDDPATRQNRGSNAPYGLPDACRRSVRLRNTRAC